MSSESQPEPEGSSSSKLASLLWVVIPAALILLGLAGLFGLTP
jgi:hypothetical protein